MARWSSGTERTAERVAQKAGAHGLYPTAYYCEARGCWVVSVVVWLHDEPVVLLDEIDLDYLLAEMAYAERAAA